MRINNTTAAGIVSTPTWASRHSHRNGQDQVKLSPAASGDSQKIERLAAAVAAGTYHVPAMQIAASMINETIAAL